ncbi:MAG TPA: MBL fold metallo-hydrolase [Vicinamibacterales bacterium]|nr:MBL fold metallo-hydrolase [Vicinamibacterales bacterium]
MRRALLCVLACSISVAGQERAAPTRTEIVPGIYVFATPGYGDVGLDGNSIAVTSRDGVLVFDTNGTPAAAAAVLAQIRSITDRPVRYVVNSHWHWDHWYGTETYLQAFPDLRVIAHEKTRALMIGPALEFNRPGLEHDLPTYVASVEQRAKSDPALQPLAVDDRFFLEQKRAVHHVFPNVTFTDRMTIALGERHIEVLNYGRGVTPGDAFVYLPNEKVLLLGDLLVNPITFALACYPTEWVHVLERIDRLDANVIVTGHGAPLHDKALLHDTLAVFQTLLQAGTAAHARGLTADEARDAILPSLHDARIRITHDDARLNADFKLQLVDWFLHRVYDALDGPLTDDIAKIPRT